MPLVWGPVVTWCLLHAFREAAAAGATAGAVVGALAGGFLAWQALEYGIHRWLFHVEPCSYWGVTVRALALQPCTIGRNMAQPPYRFPSIPLGCLARVELNVPVHSLGRREHNSCYCTYWRSGGATARGYLLHNALPCRTSSGWGQIPKCIACPCAKLRRPLPIDVLSLQVHFTLHGCHHKFPLDKGRLVFPPLPAAIAAAGLLAAARAMLPEVRPLLRSCEASTGKHLSKTGIGPSSGL